MSTLSLILGNQLFPLKDRGDFPLDHVFMAEDHELCTHFKYHKHKIMHFLISMREYRDLLERRGARVRYELFDRRPYTERLSDYLKKKQIRTLHCFEIEDKFFEERIIMLADEQGIELIIHPSPNFMVTRESFRQYLKSTKKPMMKTFYEQQRRSFGVLVEADGTPTGGQWSFDHDNRKKLPKNQVPPHAPPPLQKQSVHREEVAALVDREFADHPGQTRHFWLPTTHDEAETWLDLFCRERFEHFGSYQDSLSTKYDFLYHSLLSPSINIGHLGPEQVIARCLEHAKQKNIPMNSLEGFIRQVLGWREFVRGVYQEFDEIQQQENFFQHQRSLAPSWWSAETGIPPLDFAIQKANRWGYAHHIERLMVISNLMLLCEIHPQKAYAWFMEMFVDSSDWVMGPNVFGMGLFSDGGIFATKPYLCSSNYLRKMGHFPKGDWCDVVDGLYWRFIDKHRDFFLKQHRLSMMVRVLDKMDGKKRQTLFTQAEEFIQHQTC